MDEDYVPGASRLATLGLEIHDLLIHEPTPIIVGRGRIPGMNMAFVPSVFGLSMHALHVGRSAIELQREGRHLVAQPLTRLALETAVNAQWLVHSGEGLKGFMNEGYRQRDATIRKMATSPDPVFREGALQLTERDAREPSFTDAAARHFEQMCSALVGGHDVYVLYRLLSETSHPGPRLLDEYVTEKPEAEAGCVLSRTPNGRTGSDDRHWIWLTVVAMVWAGRALDHLQQSHPCRSRLRAVARELRVPETLALTAKAGSDYAKREQAQRRAQWKGKRPKPDSRLQRGK